MATHNDTGKQGEQLAKDEAQYGSLTKKQYAPRPMQESPKKPEPKIETPEEMEARIRAKVLRELEMEEKNRDE